MNIAIRFDRPVPGLPLVLGILAVIAPCILSGEVRADDLKSDVMSRVKQASVLVFTARSEREKGDRPMGSGSGFFINSNGLLITNNHVVDPGHGKSAEEKHREAYTGGSLVWTVVTDSGTENEKTWDAIVLYQNEAADQALMQAFDEDKSKLKTPNYLRLLPESRMQDRMKVWALGFPGGDRQRTSNDKHPEVTVTEGNVIDAPRSPGGRVRRVYTDVVARPGNSGGPMVDEDGFLVGTVTLMTKPEGREDSGGANYSALVPAKLTSTLVRYAFELGKIPDGTDVAPFMDALTQDSGRINIPEFDRQSEKDVLFFADGDRAYGKIATESITWDSPLGKFDVPTKAVAYVMNNDEGSHLFMEGGNRIEASSVGSSFQFLPDGGEATELKFADVNVVGFRKEDRELDSIDGDVMVLDTDVCHLILTDVKGTIKFEGKIGKVDVSLGDVYRLEGLEDGTHVLMLNDRRRLTGKFDDGKFTAVIATTRTPIEFSLKGAKRATVEMTQQRRGLVGGLGLSGVLAKAEEPVRKVVGKLQTGDVASARAALDPMLKPDAFKQTPDVKKDQLRLLEAVVMLREGKYAEAQKAFRKVVKAGDANVGAYAQACAAVLKKHDDGTFEGKPLSEQSVFHAAGIRLAQEQIRWVRDELKDVRGLEGEKKSEYTSNITAIPKMEESMTLAAVFAGIFAEDELIRVWKHAAGLCEREIRRIDAEAGEDRQGSRSGGRGNQQLMAREMEDLRTYREKVTENYRDYMTKLFEYGFRIEDPDIQAMRERRAEARGNDDP